MPSITASTPSPRPISERGFLVPLNCMIEVREITRSALIFAQVSGQLFGHPIGKEVLLWVAVQILKGKATTKATLPVGADRVVTKGNYGRNSQLWPRARTQRKPVQRSSADEFEAPASRPTPFAHSAVAGPSTRLQVPTCTRKNRASILMKVAMNWQVLFGFPAMDGAHLPLFQIPRDLFP